MTNLTIALEESVVRKARVRAIHEGTSVSAKVREFLADYAQGGSRQQSAGHAFVAAARRSRANTGAAAWSRDDAYDRGYPSAADADPHAAAGTTHDGTA